MNSKDAHALADYLTRQAKEENATVLTKIDCQSWSDSGEIKRAWVVTITIPYKESK